MASTIWSGSKTFATTTAAPVTIAVPMPHRGILRGYSLAQSSGTTSGFTADLCTSSQTTAPNSALPAAAFKLLTITAASGTATDADADINLAYQNRDGSPTNSQRFLYLKITPGSAGAKDFTFSVTVETPMLR